MPWQTITLTLPEQLKDAIVGEFSSDGIAGVWEREAPGGNGTEMVLYFEAGHVPPLIDARVGRVFQRNGFQAPVVKVGLQEKQDWTREWRKGFTRFPVGDRFEVVPGWEEPSRADDRIPIRIDPGLAFGMGTHETTRLVLEVLETLDPVDGTVLDLGTGSAILAIAAAKLGHSRVVACDIDSDAVEVARRNLVRNDSEVPIFLGSVDGVRQGSVDLVMANLITDVIRAVLPDIDRVLKVQGTGVFSGFLDVQADDIRREIIALGLTVDFERTLGEWVVMVARQHS
jgi:ribosomal protein L11 methyltransferase